MQTGRAHDAAPRAAHQQQYVRHEQQQHAHREQQQAVAAPLQRTESSGSGYSPQLPPPPHPQPRPAPPPAPAPAPPHASNSHSPQLAHPAQPPASAALALLSRQQQQQYQLQLQLYQQQLRAQQQQQHQQQHARGGLDPAGAAVAAAASVAQANARALEQRQVGAPGPVAGPGPGLGGGGGGGAGGPRRAQTATPDPRTWTGRDLERHRDMALEWLRDASASGGLEIELALQETILPALQAAYLPTDEHTLRRFAPDMIPLPGCTSRHYFKAYNLWAAWVQRHGLPTFPIVGTFVALCIVDNARLLATADDRHRTAELLDLYRRATAPVFADFATRYPPVTFNLPRPWTELEWAQWVAYVEQSSLPLGEWRAVRDVVRGGDGAGPLPSPVGSPQLVAPPVSRAPSWQGQGVPAPAPAHPPQQQQQRYPAPPPPRRAAAHAHASAPQAHAAAVVEQPHGDAMRRAWSNPQQQAQAQAQAHWRSQPSSQAQLAPHPHPYPHPQPQPPVLYQPQPRPTLAPRPSSSSSSSSSRARTSGSHGVGTGTFAAPGRAWAATSSAPQTPVVTPQSATFPAPASGGAAPTATATAQRALGPAPTSSAAPPPAPPPSPPASTAPAAIAVAIPLPPPHFPGAQSAAPPSASTTTSPTRRTAAAMVDSWRAQLQAAEHGARDAERVALLARLTGAGRAELDKVEGRKGKGGGKGRGRGGAARGATSSGQHSGRKEVERAVRVEQPAQGGPSVVTPPIASAPSTSSSSTQPPSSAAALAPYRPYIPAPTALAPSTSSSSATPAPHPSTSTSSSTAPQPGPLAPAAAPARTASAPVRDLRWVSQSGQRPGPGPAPPQAVAQPPSHVIAATLQHLQPIAPRPVQAAAPQPAQVVAPPPPKQKKRHKAAVQGRVPAVVRDAQALQASVDVDDAQFWAAARRVDRSLAVCAQATAAAALAAQTKAAREAQLGVSLGNTAEALASLRASPWTTGAPMVVPPRLVMSSAAVPYGDYVPGPIKATQSLRSLAAPSPIMRDPLNALKPPPSTWPPPPVIPTFTASPQSFPADLSTTVRLTAPPFLTYPSALEPLTPHLANKTWKYAADLSQHVERLMASTASNLTAPLTLADADALEIARKRILATTMHDSLAKNVVGALPDVAEPVEARRMRKRIKKARRREKKARQERERGARRADGGEKEPEVIELVDSGDEGETGTVTGMTTPMDVDSVGAGEAGTGSEGPSVTVKEKQPPLQKVDQAVAKPSTPSAAAPVPALAPVADTAAPSTPAPPAPAAAPPPPARPADNSTSSSVDAAPAADPSTAAPAPASASFPPRPTLPGALSAPVVPGSRERSNSQGAMLRRPSVSGPGIHPLAQHYATVPSSTRQMFRDKANELRGADPVALARATARLTSPALRNEAALAGSSARGSPRLGAGSGGPSLAVASPPLVPITLRPVGAGREGGGAAGAVKADEARPVEAHAPQKPTTALGMSIETPAMSTVARETSPSSDVVQAQVRVSAEKHGSPRPAPVVEKASSPAAPAAKPAASVSTAPSAEPTPATVVEEEPSPAAKSVASSGASTLTAAARATVTAVGAAAKALVPDDGSSTASPASAPALAPPQKRVVVPAAGPGVEAVAPSAPVAPAAAAAPANATTKKPRSKAACPSCHSAACPGRRLPNLCAQRQPSASSSSSSSVVPAKRSAAPSELEPDVEPEPEPERKRRPHPLRNVSRAWLAVSEPLMPFTKEIRYWPRPRPPPPPPPPPSGPS
ncbi:hypothetical protein JCM8208_001944 [Rhodotorula glutinis]